MSEEEAPEPRECTGRTCNGKMTGERIRRQINGAWVWTILWSCETCGKVER